MSAQVKMTLADHKKTLKDRELFYFHFPDARDSYQITEEVYNALDKPKKYEDLYTKNDIKTIPFDNFYVLEYGISGVHDMSDDEDYYYIDFVLEPA